MSIMKKSIVCNETWYVEKASQDRIVYTFVTNDGNTPSRVTIRANDTDIFTGDRITEQDCYDYHSIRQREVYLNLKTERPAYTTAERLARRAERERIRHEMKERYGYVPCDETVEYLLEERWGSRYVIHYDAFIDDYGESCADHFLPFSISAEDEYLRRPRRPGRKE